MGIFVNNKYYLRMKFMFLQDFMKNSINGTTESQKLITADKNEKRGSFKILDKNKKMQKTSRISIHSKSISCLVFNFRSLNKNILIS